MLTVLRNPQFRWLWLSQLISQSGDQLRNWSIIFWVFTVSGQSPVTQSLVLVAEFAPAALLGPFAGVFIDRWNRQKVMRYAHLLRALLSFCMIPAMLTVNVPVLLVLIALSSTVAQFFQPAVGATLPSIVPKDQLMAANSLSRTTMNAWTLLGPLLATALYHSLGATVTFTIDGITFLVAAICLLFVRPSQSGVSNRTSAGAKPSFWREFAEGVRYGWQNSIVRGIFLMLVTMCLGVGVVNLLSLFLIRQELNLSDMYVAWGSTAQGIGMLATAILIGSFSRKIKAHNWLTVASVAMLALGVFALGAAPNANVMLIGRVLIGVGTTALNIAITTLFMSTVPNELLGRVGSVLETAPTYAMLFSTMMASYLTFVADIRTIFYGAGAMFVLAGVIAMVELGCLRKSVKPSAESDVSV